MTRPTACARAPRGLGVKAVSAPGATAEGFDSPVPRDQQYPGRQFTLANTGGPKRPPVPPKISPHSTVESLQTVAPGGLPLSRSSVYHLHTPLSDRKCNIGDCDSIGFHRIGWTNGTQFHANFRGATEGIPKLKSQVCLRMRGHPDHHHLGPTDCFNAAAFLENHKVVVGPFYSDSQAS